MKIDSSTPQSESTDSRTFLSRRRLLAVTVTSAVATTLLAACGATAPAPAPAPSAAAAAPPAQATAAPVAPAASGSRLDKILSAQKMRVGVFLQYKPFTFKSDTGEALGWEVDVAKALTTTMGIQPEFVDNSWDGIIPAMQADKFDAIISTMTITDKRSLVVQFSNPYYIALNGMLYRSEDDKKFPNLDAFNSPNLTAAMLIQDAGHGWLERYWPQTKVEDYNSSGEVMLAVQTKKADFTLNSLTFSNEYATEHQGLSVKVVDYPGASAPIGMALLPTPDNYHLLQFLNTWIRNFHWSGTYEPIFKKWFPEQPLPKIEKFTTPY